MSYEVLTTPQDRNITPWNYNPGAPLEVQFADFTNAAERVIAAPTNYTDLWLELTAIRQLAPVVNHALQADPEHQRKTIELLSQLTPTNYQAPAWHTGPVSNPLIITGQMIKKGELGSELINIANTPSHPLSRQAGLVGIRSICTDTAPYTPWDGYLARNLGQQYIDTLRAFASASVGLYPAVRQKRQDEITKLFATSYKHILGNAILSHPERVAIGKQLYDLLQDNEVNWYAEPLVRTLEDDPDTGDALFGVYGLSRSELEKGWDKGYPLRTLPDETPLPSEPLTAAQKRRWAIDAMRNVQLLSPGIYRRMRDTYGHRVIGRYPYALLKDMDETTGVTYPHSVNVMVAGADERDMLGSQMDLWWNLQQQCLAQNIGFRMFEAWNRQEMQTHGHTADRRGWTPSWASFFVFHGHEFGGTLDEALHMGSISQYMAALVRRMVHKDGLGTFVSCKLFNNQYGFGPTLARQSGRLLAGAPATVGLTSLQLVSAKGAPPMVTTGLVEMFPSKDKKEWRVGNKVDLVYADGRIRP